MNKIKSIVNDNLHLVYLILSRGLNRLFCWKGKIVKKIYWKFLQKGT